MRAPLQAHAGCGNKLVIRTDSQECLDDFVTHAMMRLFLVLLLCILATSIAEHDTADGEDTGCGCGSSALTREAVFTSSSQKEQCINDDASRDSPALAGDVIQKDERNGAMDALDDNNDDDPFTEALIKDELAVVGKMKLKAIKEELRRRDVYNVDGPPMFSSGKKASKRELVLVLSKLRAAAAIERQGHQGSSGPSSGSSSGIRLEGGAQQAWFTETMVHVPGGAFVMGTNAPPPYPGDGEGPSRLVVVSDFLIDQAEVTNSQFAEFVASSGYETESERFGWSFVFDLALTSQAKHEIDTAVQGAEWWLPVQGADWRRPEGPHGLHVFFVKGGGGGPEEDEEEGRGVLGNGGGGDGAGWRDFKEQRGWRGEHPAVHVSWADSVSYCAWRNGSRLPTEAEWEYAAQHKGPPGRDGRKSARHASPPPPPSTLKDFAASVLTPPPALPLPTTLQGTPDGGSALALETASSSSSSSSSSSPLAASQAKSGGSGGGRSVFPWGNEVLTAMPTRDGVGDSSGSSSSPGTMVHRMNIWQGDFPRVNEGALRAAGGDGYRFTCPTNAFPPQNELGLLNMLGNVWEWVEDWWTVEHGKHLSEGATTQVMVVTDAATMAHTNRTAALNPNGPKQAEGSDSGGGGGGGEKTKKGGSFLCHHSFCYRYRTVARHKNSPDSATSNNGFRCAKSMDDDGQ